MSAASFKDSLTAVLKHEGGYVNNPRDNGGATNYGVTQRVYDAFRQLHGLPLKNVANIELGEVAQIYRQQYWEGICGDRLPEGVDYAVFDFAVNSGTARAARYLQAAVGVKADGHIGSITLAAVAKLNDRAGLVRRLCEARRTFLHGLDDFDEFGKGWLRRVAEVEATALARVGG